jgi:RNA polymerase sigma-70 factor (ECF subfamily)
MHDFTDEDMIDGLLQGRNAEAERLCRQLRPVIERTLRRLFPGCEDHDDLVQASLERVVRTLVEKRFERACSLSTWASTIAAHVGIDAMRSRTRERGLFRVGLSSSPDVLAQPEAVPLERKLEARSELSCLKDVMDALSPEQRQTLVLHDVLGLELKDIADETGVSPAAAQSRLVRGRKELMRHRNARRTLESLPEDWLEKVERKGRKADGGQQSS